MDHKNQGGPTAIHPDPRYGRLRSARINAALDSQLGFLPQTNEFSTPFASIEAELQENNIHDNGRYETPYGEAAVRGRTQSHRSTRHMAGAGIASVVSGAGSLDGIRQHVAGGKRKGKGRAAGDGQRQGAASKRSKHSKVSSRVPANNDRSQVGEDEEEEDEDEEEEEEEDSEEDDDCPSPSGPKDAPPFKCPMPSCRKNERSFNTWNNLIQHLQNTHFLGFASCPYFCGKRFGLSSQYTRHVFKNKSRCKSTWSNAVKIPPVALSLNYKITKIKRQDYGKLKRLIADHDWYDVEDTNNPHISASHIALNQDPSQQASQDHLLPGSFVQVPAGDLQQFIQRFQSYLQIQTPSSTAPPTAGSSPKLPRNGCIGVPSSGQQAGRPPLHPGGPSQPAILNGPQIGRGYQRSYPAPGIPRPSTGGSNGHTDYSTAHHTANSSPVLPRREINPPYPMDGSLRGNQPSERPPVYQTGISGPSASRANYQADLSVPPPTGGNSHELPRHTRNPSRRMGNGPSQGNRRGERPSQLPAGPPQPIAFQIPEVGGGREQLSQPFPSYVEPLQSHILVFNASTDDLEWGQFVNSGALDHHSQSFSTPITGVVRDTRHANRDFPESQWPNNPGGSGDNIF